MCIVETDHIAGKFYDRKLHSKTDTEERNFVCAGVADGFDLAFHTAVTKSAGNQDSCSRASARGQNEEECVKYV